MPTYEYRCDRCGTTIEVVQSFADAPLTTCAACEGPLRKVFAPVGIVFKGSGFYKTDSRSGTTRAAPSTKDPAKEPAGAATAKDPAGGAPSTTPGATTGDGGAAPSRPAKDKPAAAGA